MAGSCWAEPCLLRSLPDRGESRAAALPLEPSGILPRRGCVREGARGRLRQGAAVRSRSEGDGFPLPVTRRNSVCLTGFS